MFSLISFWYIFSTLIKLDITSQGLDSKSSYPENDASVGSIIIPGTFNSGFCTWDAFPSYVALFGLQQNICSTSHKDPKQAASQLISETTTLVDSLRLVETSARTSAEEQDSVANLPPLEDAAVGDMEQNPIPTFNEFHAMLSEEQGGLKADPGSARTDPLFSHDKRIIPSGGPTSDDSDPSNGSLPDNDQRPKGEQFNIQNAKLNAVPLRPSEAIADANESKHTDISLPDTGVQVTTDSTQTDQNQNSAVDNTGLPIDGTYTSASVTLRRNVAASGCFAKLLEASKAIKNPDAVLNDNTDEYMNVPCSAEKWFVIEVCEPVILREIELANYELFSSRVKLFRVFVSDRYPAKTWDTLGTFNALDVKGKQTFKVNGDKLIKYVKFDLMEHYGSEHYCPLTMVRLFGRVSDDLDDEEEDELNGNLDHETRSASSDENISHGTNTNGASVAHAGSDWTSVDAVSSLHATGSKASPDQQFLHVNPTAAGGIHTLSEAPSSGLNENSPSVAANIDSSRLVPGQKGGASLPGQILPIIEPIQAGKDAVKPRSDQLPRADKSTPSSSSDISDDPCHTDPSNSCSTSGSSDDVNANIADRKVRRRIEPVYPPDDLRPHATFPSNSTSHATIIPLKFSDKFPIDGRSSLGGSNVVISVLNRIRNFFFDIFGSTLRLTADKRDTREYNLSAIELCPRHLSAIGALLSYGLLSNPDTTSSPNLMITLSERQLRGLRSLAQCFRLLDQRTHVFNSDHLSPHLAVHHRVLVLPKNAGELVMASCNTATQLLNMEFAPNNDSYSHRNNQETASYNILQLFLAYQYRIQLQRTHLNISYQRASISPTEHVLYNWWISGGSRELVPHIQSTCPKLPDFLSHLMSLTTVDPPASPAPGSTRCSNASSSTVPREPISPHQQRSTNAVMREQIVVPAALAGSRKDTALMRLTNRVRLLERNVSVSMRYLEELSQSYKRQMERLSRSFNLTTAWLKATARGAEERDQAQQTRISTLEQRLEELLSQFRSASNEFHDSNSSAASDSKPDRDLTLELEEVSAPPALSFDAPPDWNPSASGWPPLADDWLEDGVVETEDDDPIELHQRPLDSDRIRHIRPYRAEGVLPASDWSPRDCERQVASDWKSVAQRWFVERFKSLLNFKILPWHLLPTSSPNVFWILYMTLLHLTFAAASHAFVYLTWLRPQSRKLSCAFDSLSFVHQTPLAWTCSNHLTLPGPCSYLVRNANSLQAHNVRLRSSNGDCGLSLPTSPENHTTGHPKFPPLIATSLNNAESNSVDTIGTCIPVGSDTHRLPDLCSLHDVPLHSSLSLNGTEASCPAARRRSDCSETYFPRISVPNEPLRIRVDDSSSSTPSSKCVASLDQPSPPVLSKRARKRHKKRVRANWIAR